MATKKQKKLSVAKSVEVMEKPAEAAVIEEKKVKKPARRKAKETTAAAAPATAAYYCVIDYPTNGETVSGLHYAIRMGASEVPGAYVEIQINGGPWNPSRYADGYWWFDWGYFTAGPHKLQARLVDQEGNVLKKSTITKCQVI